MIIKNNMYFEILCYGDNIKSKYVDFPLDFNLELSKQLDLLKEDLIHIEYTNGYILDVGYYPEFNPKGKFKIVVSKGIYYNQIVRYTTKDINILIEKIKIAVNFISKGV